MRSRPGGYEGKERRDKMDNNNLWDIIYKDSRAFGWYTDMLHDLARRIIKGIVALRESMEV